METKRANRWHLFCRVVDNYGDAGVCWRLARELAAEHALDVTLFIDGLDTLARIEPALDPSCASQRAAGVRVQRVDAAQAHLALPAVVVEGFGCGLPAPYVTAMAAAADKPLWINLEYLSAERWVDGAHGLPSPHPRLPLVRHFWFPGFTPKTGGLLRERGLLATRDAWQARHPHDAAALRVCVFAYDNAALPALFQTWATGAEDVACSVGEGVAAASLATWLGAPAPSAGGCVRRGRLAIHVEPFTDQDGFDRRLWDADVNFVRGEDSFVRAQWAARPFVWQPYRQPENAQHAKLAAFLERYTAALPPATRDAVEALFRACDEARIESIAAAWRRFRSELPVIARHARTWADDLATLPELGSSLVEFSRDRL